MADKTAYILGAGASRTANLPLQSELLQLIYSINISERTPVVDKDFLFLDLNETAERVREIYPIFDIYRQSLGEFIVNNFSSKDKIDQYHVAIKFANDMNEIDYVKKNEFLFKAYDIVKNLSVSLEDLFTIFDNVAVGREHFRLYSPDSMGKIHNELKLCIIYSLVYSLSTNCDDSEYKRFAKLLFDKRLKSSQKEDVISIITMNWDNVLEHVLHELCSEYNSSVNRGQQKIYPDLCIYDYSLYEVKGHLPSTLIKAKGHKNIKILKMHGSLGWLECPKCGRIYSDHARQIAAEEYEGVQCPNCRSDDSLIGEDPVLRNLIVTPTFLKALSNLNLKNIWHNAYIDVNESDHLVFIGYSFPDADFEMRCLLKKAVNNNARITVVLHGSDDPKKYETDLIEKGYSTAETRHIIEKMNFPERRYKSFFGEEKVDFYYSGLNGFLDEIGGNISG